MKYLYIKRYVYTNLLGLQILLLFHCSLIVRRFGAGNREFFVIEFFKDWSIIQCLVNLSVCSKSLALEQSLIYFDTFSKENNSKF